MAFATALNTRAQADLACFFKGRGGIRIALTLTFRPNRGRKLVDNAIASKAMTHFLAKLNRRVFRNAHRRFGRRLEVIAVREGGGGHHKQVHYHLDMRVPDRWSVSDFGGTCLEVWRSLRWASQDQNVIRESDDGWIDYMLKFRDKNDYFDAVDVINTHLH
jgi:hypothetical protein